MYVALALTAGEVLPWVTVAGSILGILVVLARVNKVVATKDEVNRMIGDCAKGRKDSCLESFRGQFLPREMFLVHHQSMQDRLEEVATSIHAQALVLDKLQLELARLCQRMQDWCNGHTSHGNK